MADFSLANLTASFPLGKIDRPCYIDGLSMSIYHSDCCAALSVSSGDLVKVEVEGLRNYWKVSYMNPARYVLPDKPAYILGRLAHTLVLGDTAFDALFALRPFDSYRTDRAKAWRLRTLIAGKTPVTQAELDTANYMADELRLDPLARTLIEGAIIERTFITKRRGVYIKSRPDFLERGARTVGDYKKSRRTTKRDLLHDITKFDYTMKMANIGEAVVDRMPELGAETIFDLDYVFVMQSDVPPFTVFTVQITPREGVLIDGDKVTADESAAVRDSIYWAACQNRRSLNRIADARDAGEWPAAEEGVINYSYPQWLCDRLKREQDSGMLPLLNDRLEEVTR